MNPLDYIERGCPVVPLHEPGDDTPCSCGHDDCTSPAKHPRTPNGLKDATTDPEVVDQRWSRWPTANIGIRTGIVFDALDIDPGGLDTLSRLAGGDEALISAGPVVRTPRGGAHIYFEPTGVGNRVGFRPGLDWRGHDGYVVAPASIGFDGDVVVAYDWHMEGGETFDLDRPLVPPPGWLRALLEPAEVSNERNLQARFRTTIPTNGQPGTLSQAYLRAALEAEARTVAHASEGCRNDQLNRSTHTLARLDDLDAATIETVMLAAALEAGLSEREAGATIGSALRARGRQ